ncbi:MAG: hypothetical protein ABEJ60_00365 [Halodesulfurarchaeum sp.]
MTRKRTRGASTAGTGKSRGCRCRQADDAPRGAGDRTRRRDEHGQYVERMTESGILELFERVPGPVIATTDVAEHFDSTTEGARRKLNEMCDAGRLDRRKVGGTRVYWRTDIGNG